MVASGLDARQRRRARVLKYRAIHRRVWIKHDDVASDILTGAKYYGELVCGLDAKISLVPAPSFHASVL